MEASNSSAVRNGSAEIPGGTMTLRPSIVLALAFSFTIVPPLAFGQTPMTPSEWAEFSTEKLTTPFHLSEEQVEKIKALNLKVFHRAEKAHQTQADSQTRMARAVRRILQDRGNELKKVLTPDQWRKLQMTRLEQSVRFRTDMISLVLRLTAAQAARVNDANEDAFRKVQEAQKQLLTDKLKMIEAVRSIQEEREKELEEVLAPYQWKIYQEIQREFPDIFHRKIKEPKKGNESAGQSGIPPGRFLTVSMEGS